MTWSYLKLRSVFKVLVRSDKRSRSVRIRRMIWCAENLHFEASITSDSRTETAAMETEAQRAFITGHFISTLMISMAYCEHTLCDLGFAGGKLLRERNRLEIVEAAVKELKIFKDDFWTEFQRLQDIRNTYAHRTWVEVPVRERADASLSERWAPHPLSLTGTYSSPKEDCFDARGAGQELSRSSHGHGKRRSGHFDTDGFRQVRAAHQRRGQRRFFKRVTPSSLE